MRVAGYQHGDDNIYGRHPRLGDVHVPPESIGLSARARSVPGRANAARTTDSLSLHLTPLAVIRLYPNSNGASNGLRSIFAIEMHNNLLFCYGMSCRRSCVEELSGCIEQPFHLENKAARRIRSVWPGELRVTAARTASGNRQSRYSPIDGLTGCKRTVPSRSDRNMGSMPRAC
jgi:hypothetical protein